MIKVHWLWKASKQKLARSDLTSTTPLLPHANASSNPIFVQTTTKIKSTTNSYVCIYIYRHFSLSFSSSICRFFHEFSASTIEFFFFNTGIIFLQSYVQGNFRFFSTCDSVISRIVHVVHWSLVKVSVLQKQHQNSKNKKQIIGMNMYIISKRMTK